MATLTQPTTAKTCADCPYFENFSEPKGRGWCYGFDQMARSYHERTAACDQEIEALENKAQQQPPEPEQEPVSNAWDKVSYQLQPATEAETEFEQGRLHGQNDALAKWHPIYQEPATAYARGYLSGYNAVLNATAQQPKISAPQEWSVSYDPTWQWYQAWVGDRCIGQGTTHQEAERIAQKYIAMNELIRRQNAAVMAAYASVVAS